MAPIHRVLSKPLNRPYRTRHLDSGQPPFVNGEGYVDFAPGDIENPRNWSPLRRWVVTMSGVLLCLNATFASSSPSGCIASLSKHFGISSEVAGLTITLFLLGYCAGPLIFAPLSEFYGRRWIFFISFSLYVAFSFLCAWPTNLGALLVGRFLAGTMVSASLSNVPGMLADVWEPLDRANALAAFCTVLFIGPALSPVVAGFLELKKDWRWCFYVLLWLAGGTWLIMLTIPETFAPAILASKARRTRKARVPGYEEVRARVEDSGKSLVGIYKVALTRPWIILFDPISFFIAVYMAVVYTLLYMLFDIYPIVFQEKRGWNAGVGELPLIGTIVGAVLAGFVVVWDSDHKRKKIARGELRAEDLVPESGLPLAMGGGMLLPISVFWFAWSAEYNSVHWIVCTIAGGGIAASMVFIFLSFTNYLVDTYLMFAASAIAANTILRSACGAASPLFTNYMFQAMGIGGGGSLIGGVSCVLAIIPFVFYKYGGRIRERSKYASAGSKGAQRDKDEEANPADYALRGPEGSNDSSTSSGQNQSSSDERSFSHDQPAKAKEANMK